MHYSFDNRINTHSWYVKNNNNQLELCTYVQFTKHLSIGVEWKMYTEMSFKICNALFFKENNMELVLNKRGSVF